MSAIDLLRRMLGRRDASPGALDELPEGPVAIACWSGARSRKAVAMAVANGRRDVQNVAGGFTARQAAGLPIDPHPHPRGTA